ncbi:MAG: 30S ribosomal protein S9 [Flavobacteriales bacterium]|jgi:small subunit ribosomal protein S9|nr:30S ribosomal protein S9 [Flavobacteriales bacterium]|tara:strand:- start:11148 stop:11534 length:387 start_codon:yes stop_codon:yes gene_type:complete
MEVVHTIGRRKKAVARVYLSDGKGLVTVNGIDVKDYFSTATLQYKLEQAQVLAGVEGIYDINVNVDGGGITGQAEAIRLGISRALIKIDPDHRLALKPHGLLTRDPRMVERKKPGQKKARKKFQFSKR